MFGWIREGRTTEAQQAAGWSGVISLSRTLTLGGDGQLRIAPVPELKALRGTHRRITDLPVSPTAHVRMLDLPADQLELIAEIDPGAARLIALDAWAMHDIWPDT